MNKELERTRVRILQMLHEGTISVDEASKLLEALSGADRAEADRDEGRAFPGESVEPPAVPLDLGRFRRLSYLPFAASLALVGLTGGGAYTLYLRTEGRITFGFVVLLALFAMALLAAALAMWATTAPWLHVRIHSAPDKGPSGTRIAISLPVPLTLAGWVMRLANRFVDRQAADERTVAPDRLAAAAALVQAIGHDLGKPGAEPIVVDVNDNDERVQVYIG